MGPTKSSAKFQEARSAVCGRCYGVEDEQALTLRDHGSTEEERWITLGMDASGSLLVVVYTWRAKKCD
jgi:uncharacterized DUF497 family protein